MLVGRQSKSKNKHQNGENLNKFIYNYKNFFTKLTESRQKFKVRVRERERVGNKNLFQQCP